MPDRFAEIAAFATDTTISAVIVRLERYLSACGYSGFAIGVVPQPPDYQPDGFLYHNWPEEFTQAYISAALGRIDPTLRYALSRSRPVSLRALATGKTDFEIRPEEHQVFELGRRNHRGDGALIPLFGPQGYRGIAAFLARSRDPGPAELAELQLLAIRVHDRLAELHSNQSQSPMDSQPVLSDRERQVLELAKTGLKDEEVAEALGISVRTVRFHFSNTRKKLNAPSRAVALVTAVNLQLI